MTYGLELDDRINVEVYTIVIEKAQLQESVHIYTVLLIRVYLGTSL